MKAHRAGSEEPLLLARCAQEGVLGGTFLAAAKTICFGGPACFCPAQHCLPTYAYSSVEQKYASGQADELQDRAL